MRTSGAWTTLVEFVAAANMVGGRTVTSGVGASSSALSSRSFAFALDDTSSIMLSCSSSFAVSISFSTKQPIEVCRVRVWKSLICRPTGRIGDWRMRHGKRFQQPAGHREASSSQPAFRTNTSARSITASTGLPLIIGAGLVWNIWTMTMRYKPNGRRDPKLVCNSVATTVLLAKAQ